MVIADVLANDSTYMSFVEGDDMVQTISADGSDNPLTKRILPWRTRRRDKFLDTQTFDPSLNHITINRIPVAQQLAWSGIEGEGFKKLLCCPLSGGMRCHIEVHEVTTVMAEHDKHIKNAKSGGRDSEEINPSYTIGMVFEKCPPGLRRRFLLRNHIF